MAKADDDAAPGSDTRRLLGGIAPATFLRRHWQRQPRVVRDAFDPPAALADPALLFALAERDDVESRLVAKHAGALGGTRGGAAWTLAHGPIPKRLLPPRSRPGWTLLVQGVDLHHDAARALLDRFRFRPDARLDDLMVSWASEGGGVGPHVDDYDVFLLQLAGIRRWRLAPVPQPRWQRGAPLKLLRGFRAEETHELGPGDLLYLPPGWGHDGVARGGECLTASVGFRAPRAAELAREVLVRAAEAFESEAGRAASKRYRDATAAPAARAAAMPAELLAFARAAVASALARPAALARALGEVLSEPKPGVWFEPGPRPSAARLARAGVRADRRTRLLHDERHLFVNGEAFTIGGRDGVLLRRMADDRALPGSDVAKLSPAALDALRDWVRDGWLQAGRAEPGRGAA
jgi:50S ribosomal protein L16 3-hydroxylase